MCGYRRMDMNNSVSKYFKNNITRFESVYSRSGLFDKLKRVARKAGVKVVHAVLVLYYASLDKNVPAKDRLLIIAALGYFICPLDLLPDALPAGFLDDFGTLGFVIRSVWRNLTPETFARAREKTREWFGQVDETDLDLPGKES